MKYYIIAGEASGDLHGSNLMKGLQENDPHTDFRVWGGDLMEQVGGKLVKHYRDLAFMGFLEVAQNIRTILGNIKFCKEDILAYKPDVLILIDYPGFNLRIAKWAKEQGIRVFYYISPQIWAWHTSRVKKIKATVDRMFVILPFEADFYKKYDVDVDFVGHPLLDVIPNYQPQQSIPSGKPVIALLPGSRKQEIERMLDIMLSAVNEFPDHQFIIAGAPSIDPEFYQQILEKHHQSFNHQPQLVHNQTYTLLSTAKAALVTSGTATLETALFDVPQVVCYKGSFLSYQIAKRLVKVDYISLVNLISEKLVVKELIQDALTPANLKLELGYILSEKGQQRIKKDYQYLRAKLGGPGASKRAAELMNRNIGE